MRLVHVLQMVLLGFVTGGIGATVFLAWLLRRDGEPTVQGRRALLYILASTVGIIGVALYLVLYA